MSSGEDENDFSPEIIEITERLLQRISGIVDPRQRSYALGSKLKRLDAETILEVFRLITARAQLKVDRYEDGFRTISNVRHISKHLGFGLMSEVYSLARSRGHDDVVRFMRAVPPARRLGEDEQLEEDPMLRDMTLGGKRQKARMRDRDLINRLCHEQDPVIIEHLLKNPAVTIKEVVKIASKRPTSAEILRTVYKDLKWSNHYVVKKALVNNPYTPTEISVSLLHFLLEQDLEDVADNMLLHPVVKDQAVNLILARRRAAKARRETRNE